MSISLLNLHPPPADLQRLVRDGLRRSPRQLPAWMLYDAEGSRLFAEICRQPEYTLTQREIALLEENAAAIAAATGPGLVVEFGIGNARKVDPLLTALGSSVFAALDISLSALKEALSGLAARHPNTAMVGICCDHTRLEQLPQHPALDGQRRIGFFPGSSLGNFTPEEAVDFLRNARQLLAGGPLLLGLDQPREPALMEAAYDDAAGVSAAFARNLLQRLNRDLQGDADPTQFRYRAHWQARQQRIDVLSDGHSTVVAEVRQCAAWRERTIARRLASGEVAVCAAKRERELAAVALRAPVLVACCDSASAGCILRA